MHKHLYIDVFIHTYLLCYVCHDGLCISSENIPALAVPMFISVCHRLFVSVEMSVCSNIYIFSVSFYLHPSFEHHYLVSIFTSASGYLCQKLYQYLRPPYRPIDTHSCLHELLHVISPHSNAMTLYRLHEQQVIVCNYHSNGSHQK